jgi:hypothetical protein
MDLAAVDQVPAMVAVAARALVVADRVAAPPAVEMDQARVRVAAPVQVAAAREQEVVVRGPVAAWSRQDHSWARWPRQAERPLPRWAAQ